MYSRKKIPDHFLTKPNLSPSTSLNEPLPLEAKEKISPSPDVHRRIPLEALLFLHLFSREKKG